MLHTMRTHLTTAAVVLLTCLFSSLSCAKQPPTAKTTPMTTEDNSSLETATFGAGCFWCVEAVFENIDGVKAVESGYMGGQVKDPTYREICTGTTGHAEVTRIEFDPRVVGYETLLDWLWRSHDPTTLNRQGADRGTQYRSAIFYHSEAQRQAAELSKAAAQTAFASPSSQKSQRRRHSIQRKPIIRITTG